MEKNIFGPSKLKTLVTHCEALCEELKVVDERLHAALHLGAVGRDTLGVISPDVTSRHLVEALLDDSEALTHLQHPHEIAVVRVAVGPHRYVEVNQVVSIVGLCFPQVVLDA